MLVLHAPMPQVMLFMIRELCQLITHFHLSHAAAGVLENCTSEPMNIMGMQIFDTEIDLKIALQHELSDRQPLVIRHAANRPTILNKLKSQQLDVATQRIAGTDNTLS